MSFKLIQHCTLSYKKIKTENLVYFLIYINTDDHRPCELCFVNKKYNLKQKKHSMKSQKTGKQKSLNIALWIAQSLLAIMFLMPGFMKTTQPISQLGTMMPWVNNAPLALVRFIGIAEILGAVGLLLPSILRINPRLSGFAAIGLGTVMLFATVFHLKQGETNMIGITITILLIATFIAWGRLVKAPIPAKGTTAKPTFSTSQV